MTGSFQLGRAKRIFTLTVFRKGAGGCVRAHGCGLTGKMTGGRPKIRLGPSAITLIELSVMALVTGKAIG